MKSRTAKIMLATTLTTAGLSIPMASPAFAVPAYCSASQSGNGAKAYCYTSASGSQFRAVARCRYVTPTGSYDHANFYGSWRRQGDPNSSYAACGTGWNFVSAEAQTR